MRKVCLLSILALSATLQAAHVKPIESADGYRENLIVGTVVAVKPELALITIRESDLLGHLRIRFKCYQVRQPFLLNGLHVGDKVSAVLSSRDNMLHRVRRVESYGAFAPGPVR